MGRVLLHTPLAATSEWRGVRMQLEPDAFFHSQGPAVSRGFSKLKELSE